MMVYVTQSGLEFLVSSDSLASVSQEYGTLGPNSASTLTGLQSVNRYTIVPRINATIGILQRKDCSGPVSWFNA